MLFSFASVANMMLSEELHYIFAVVLVSHIWWYASTTNSIIFENYENIIKISTDDNK